MTKLKWFDRFGLMAVLGLTSIQLVQGQFIVSGNVTDPGGTFTLTLLNDITFNTTPGASADYLIFDEWLTPAGGSIVVFPSASTQVSYQIDSNPIYNRSVSFLLDTVGVVVNGISQNDGVFAFSNISNLGQTLTIKAGSWSFTGDSNFNPGTVGTFTGNVFLADVNGSAVSALTPVPEPHEYAMVAGLGLVGYAVWRRRNRR